MEQRLIGTTPFDNLMVELNDEELTITSSSNSFTYILSDEQAASVRRGDGIVFQSGDKSTTVVVPSVDIVPTNFRYDTVSGELRWDRIAWDVQQVESYSVVESGVELTSGLIDSFALSAAYAGSSLDLYVAYHGSLTPRKVGTIEVPSDLDSDEVTLDVPLVDVAYGSWTAADWDAFFSPLPRVYSEGEGNVSAKSEGGERVLEMKLTPSSIGSERNNVQAFLPGNRQGYESTERIRLVPGFSFGGNQIAAKIGLAGLSMQSQTLGRVPGGGDSASDGFSLRTMYQDPSPSDSNPKIAGYYYGADKVATYGTTGEYLYLNNPPDLVPGVWYEIKKQVILNSDFNTSDGEIRIWIDGVLQYESTNRRILSSGDMDKQWVIQGETFWGGNTSAYSGSNESYVQYGAPVYKPLSSAVTQPQTLTIASPAPDFTLSGTGLSVDVAYGDGWVKPDRIDLWIKHPDINDGEFTDLSSSVEYPATRLVSTIPIPRGGAQFTIYIRSNHGGPVFDPKDSDATMTMFSAPAAPTYGSEFDQVLASVDAALLTYDSWWENEDDPRTVPGHMTSDRGYHAAAGMRGLTRVAEATDNPTYLDRAIQTAYKWIDSALPDSYANTNNKGWYYLDNTLTQPEYQVEHHQWRAGAGIADILLEMKRSGYTGPAGTQDKFLTFLKNELWEKWRWQSASSGLRIAKRRGGVFSNRATTGMDLVGRWVLIAMALDQYDDNTGNNEYYRYITQSNDDGIGGNVGGRWYLNAKSMEDAGRHFMPYDVDDHDNLPYSNQDVSHAGDFSYSMMRAKQLGYNPEGKMQETLDSYERLVQNKLFPTNRGFREMTDGTGSAANAGNNNSAHGHALSSALNSTLRDRWIEYYLYQDMGFDSQGNKIPNYLYPVFNHAETRLIWMAGGLLWALAGNSL